MKNYYLKYVYIELSYLKTVLRRNQNWKSYLFKIK